MNMKKAMSITSSLISAGFIAYMSLLSAEPAGRYDTTELTAHGVKYGPETPADFVMPADDVLKKKLTALQYKVTQKDGTERPFQNEYWDNKRDGIYVDIVSGEPLFSSTHKFKSGTGWPSFTKPIIDDALITRKDRYLFRVRTELRSRLADSHLGHVFDDGPAPTGLRYCINSASLRFIPKDLLAAEGYSQFTSLFQ